MSTSTRTVSSWFAGASAAAVTLAAVGTQCGAPEPQPRVAVPPSAARPASVDGRAGVEAWRVVYGVLQHPRCANCHPAGDVPLQGDRMQPHMQNVQRGPDGHGLYAMRCDACHQPHNLPGAHQPPGAPSWHLPHPDMPLVFVGRSSGELCRQLKDRARNGGKTPEQIFEHMASEKLVLWGWDPGEGRAPVPTPHPELVRALRIWIDSDCACPD